MVSIHDMLVNLNNMRELISLRSLNYTRTPLQPAQQYKDINKYIAGNSCYSLFPRHNATPLATKSKYTVNAILKPKFKTKDINIP